MHNKSEVAQLRERIEREMEMSEQEKPRRWLWMLVCDDGFCHELVPFYAVCEAEAERQARTWLSEQTRALTFVELRPYPAGFVVVRRRLPGWIQDDCGTIIPVTG